MLNTSDAQEPPPQKTTSLTIGLPIYNEAHTLQQFFAAIGKAVEHLPPHVCVETIACLNGTTDRSQEILEKIAKEPLGKKINLTIITSKKGKMNAQVKIVQERHNSGPIAFLDADTLPAENMLSALLDALERDNTCQACFATVRPYYDPEHLDKLTYFQKAQRAQFKSYESKPPPRYLHGRAFMLRDDRELRGIYDDIDDRLAKIEDKALVERFNLGDGPLVDDIYLSRSIAHKYGFDSIRAVPDTVTYFHPPTDEEELRTGIIRTATEMKRLALLYPEFAHLEDDIRKNPVNATPPSVSQEVDPETLEMLRYVGRLKKQIWKETHESLERVASPNGISGNDSWGNLLSTKRAFPQETSRG